MLATHPSASNVAMETVNKVRKLEYTIQEINDNILLEIPVITKFLHLTYLTKMPKN